MRVDISNFFIESLLKLNQLPNQKPSNEDEMFTLNTFFFDLNLKNSTLRFDDCLFVIRNCLSDTDIRFKDEKYANNQTKTFIEPIDSWKSKHKTFN